MKDMLLRLLPHLAPAWLFVPPAVVFAWGCALEKFADGVERLLAIRNRIGGSDGDDANA